MSWAAEWRLFQQSGWCGPRRPRKQPTWFFERRDAMKLGLFMMPLHDPAGDYMKILQQDREAILLAEKLGYAEAWVGEHYSAATEPIPDPLQFMATLIPVTT